MELTDWDQKQEYASQLDQEITVCQVTVRRLREMIGMISEDLQMRCEGTISARVAKSNGSASGQRVESVRDYKLTRHQWPQKPGPGGLSPYLESSATSAPLAGRWQRPCLPSILTVPRGCGRLAYEGTFIHSCMYLDRHILRDVLDR